MTHLPDLINDLALILMSAAIFALLSRKLRQPVVLGYILAGFVVGPHFEFLPSIIDVANINIWAEIGVIFLLFALGLEFSFKRLFRVGRSALITAVVEIVFMVAFSYGVARVLGWSVMDSVFLGGILAISSTTIIIRVIDELGLKRRRFVSLVFGVLIVEDLAAILLLVMLSSLAATRALSGADLVYTGARLGFFLVLWFLVGTYLLPNLMKWFREHLTDETTLIVAVGLCLGMVLIASNAGFSVALGAFAMGSLLAETKESQRIEHLIKPVRDLFAAIFFVSVGMLIDPKILYEHLGIIILLTLVTIVGKTFSTSLGALLSGQNLKHSVQTGLSLAQIGEFSFIIATLGLTTKVTSEFLYPVAVAVSAVTTFTTPYLIRFADPSYEWLDRKLPSHVHDAIARYQAGFTENRGPGVLSLLWRTYGLKMLFNSVMVVSIVLGTKRLLLPVLLNLTSDGIIFTPVVGLSCLILASPFLWAIAFGKPTLSSANSMQDARRLANLQFGVVLFRVLVLMALFFVIITRFFTFNLPSAIALMIFAALAFVANRLTGGIYLSLEGRFLANLSEKELEEHRQRRKVPELAPWDATLAEFVISANSPLILKTLSQSSLKESFGVTVALIERGHDRILAPGRDDVLLPADRIYLIGTEDQLIRAQAVIEALPHHPHHREEKDSYSLESLLLGERSPFVGKSIRECGLREAINGLIVGLQREGRRILSPDSAMVLEANDLLWVVADREKVRALKQS